MKGVCCIHLPMSAVKKHPVIPKSLERIKNTFPSIEFEDLVRLVPKTSPRFLKTGASDVNLQYQEAIGKLQVSDWVLGFGSIENKILNQFETPFVCLILLK